MGLYDRDYLRDDDDEPTGFRPRAASGPQTVVAKLVIINVAIWVVDLFSNGTLRELFKLNTGVVQQPWKLYELLSYSFVHSTEPMHVIFNMLGLWSFGGYLEGRLGSREFLRFYLLAAVCGGLAYLGRCLLLGYDVSVIGASGSVNAVVILFALLNPDAIIMVMMVLPMKAWVAAVLFVLGDMFGMSISRGFVAHDVHLAGAAFALLYHYNRWNLTRLSGGINLDWLTSLTKRRPKLRVFSEPNPADVEARVDAILQKISEQGEASLTKAERKTLEDASRRYQKRKTP